MTNPLKCSQVCDRMKYYKIYGLCTEVHTSENDIATMKLVYFLELAVKFCKILRIRSSLVIDSVLSIYNSNSIHE